jgi:hypothetical protein
MLLAWAMHIVVKNHRVDNNHVEVVPINEFDWLNRNELKLNNNADWATRLPTSAAAGCTLRQI